MSESSPYEHDKSPYVEGEVSAQHDNPTGAPDTGTLLFKLADRVIGLITLTVWLLVLIVVGLLIFYGYLITQPAEITKGATIELRELVTSLWEQVTPYVAQFIHLVAPAFVLLFALGVLHRLKERGATPFDTSKIFADLPSLFALLIVITICLLPLSGFGVPDVLNNVALVVVGFYFGKRRTSEE